MIFVPDEIHPNAKFLVVGEAPGKNEIECIPPTPFIGASGRMLFEDFLLRANIRRENCHITNVVPVRPPDNDFDRLPEIGFTKHQFLPQLEKTVRSKQWRMIIVVGEEAMRSVTGKNKITKQHGSLIEDQWSGSPVFPMIHPAALMRQQFQKSKEDQKRVDKWIAWSFMDMQKLREIINDQIIRPPKRELITFGQYKSVDTFLNEIKSLNQGAEIVSFDIETFRGTITTVGLAGERNRAISIPFTGQFSATDECRLVTEIAALFNGPCWKIAHNAAYDVTYFSQSWGIAIRNFHVDTMLLHHAIHPELPHGLDFLCGQYTLQPYYKDMRKETKSYSYSDTAWRYNALDACITWECYEEMMKEARRLKLWGFYHNKVHPLLGAICRMQMKGITIDEKKQKEKIAEIEEEIKIHTRILQGLTGIALNPNSSKQVQDYFYGQLKIPKIIKRKSGTVSADEESLKKISLERPDLGNTVETILAVRGRRKLLGFLKSEQESDGKMRTFYNISGTVTGRLSSGENIWGRGTNLQNIPDSVREIFIPSNGKIFFGADLSQAEDRVVAFLSGDPTLMEIYEKGLDSHRVMAEVLFSVGYNDVSTTQRNTAKACKHGWNYGMRPKTMVDTVTKRGLELNIEEATKICNTLDNKLFFVVQWRRRIADIVKSTRELVTPYGRRRVFLGRFSDDLLREAYAFIPQSTVGDHIDFSLRGIEKDFSNAGIDASVLLQVHDAVDGECLERDREIVERIIKKWLERELPIECNGKPLIIPCEFKTGNNWKEVS